MPAKRPLGRGRRGAGLGPRDGTGPKSRTPEGCLGPAGLRPRLRQNRQRCIGFDPTATFFKPRGIPMPELDIMELHLDEMEALRLCDMNGLDQEEAADRMSISQSTLQRTLAAARHKVATALAKGQAIQIIG